MSRRVVLAALLAAGMGIAGCASPPDSTNTPSPAASIPTSASARASVSPTAAASSTTGSGGSDSPSPSDTPGASSGSFAACLAQAQRFDIPERAGQLYMMAINAGTPIDTAVADLGRSGAGAVILLGNRTDGLAVISQYTQALQAAAPAGVPLLIAVDQEGGLVQRLQGPGFATIPPAIEQGQLSDAELVGSWQRWGRELRNAGVNFNLAPVADVVPTDQVAVNEPVGQLQRGFGPEADVVGRQVAQVISGLSNARVASSAKHFPGLGQVPQNTDHSIGHDTTSTLSDAELASFVAAIEAGVGSVMVSSAIYDQVDPNNPAVFSSEIVTGILRERLGFDGVVISDDLGVAASVAAYPMGERGVRFLQAGGDMVIVADPAGAQTMVEATIAAAQADPAFADELATKVARLLALKASVGLLTCG